MPPRKRKAVQPPSTTSTTSTSTTSTRQTRARKQVPVPVVTIDSDSDSDFQSVVVVQSVKRSTAQTTRSTQSTRTRTTRANLTPANSTSSTGSTGSTCVIDLVNDDLDPPPHPPPFQHQHQQQHQLPPPQQQPQTKRNPTPEQQRIIDFGATLNHNSGGVVVRIVAGAGTGKTTTLQLLAETLTKNRHRILYIVYNKAAQTDAEERFKHLGPMVQCRTMHGAAMQYMTKPSPSFEFVPVDDHELIKKIERDYSNTVRLWMQHNFKGPPVTSANAAESAKAMQKRIQLCCFYIFKTLETFYRSSHPRQKLSDTWLTYYPAKLKHQSDWKFPEGRFYVDAAAAIWDKMWTGQFPITHDAYLKYAQLGNFVLPPYITTILMDESQDSSACQLDLFVVQLAKNPFNTHPRTRNIFIVGDAAQSIYYFRGARPKELAQIQNHFEASNQSGFTSFTDFSLTRSFRFGETVARVANTLLWMKSNSPQAKDFNPYCLVGGSSTPGTLLSASEELPYPYTIIARSGLKLIMKGLEALAKHKQRFPDPSTPPLRIAINGNAKEYHGKMKDALDVYRLWKKQKPINPKFHEWETFEEFEKDVQDRELGEYVLLITLVETYQDETPSTILSFETSILTPNHTLHTADIILSTAHQSKGLEYDHVEVSDDFIDLEPKEKKRDDSSTAGFRRGTQVPSTNEPKEKVMEWGLKAWGDDLNLWYVAVTRPKKLLKLPDRWWGIMEYMELVRGGKTGLSLDGKEALREEDVKALKTLFEGLDGYLEGRFCR
ncbi:hypothetical protein HDU79_005124 [Rhizoclosmatium sp. JEL0117]|nr:hypothetical protein HDU79_005124 [Rhizoclosmatium sp. JEL0117]